MLLSFKGHFTFPLFTSSILLSTFPLCCDSSSSMKLSHTDFYLLSFLIFSSFLLFCFTEVVYTHIVQSLKAAEPSIIFCLSERAIMFISLASWYLFVSLNNADIDPPWFFFRVSHHILSSQHGMWGFSFLLHFCTLPSYASFPFLPLFLGI